MSKLIYRAVLLLLFSCLSFFAGSQGNDGTNAAPYYLALQRELVYGGVGAVSLGVGTILQNNLSAPLRQPLPSIIYTLRYTRERKDHHQDGSAIRPSQPLYRRRQ